MPPLSMLTIKIQALEVSEIYVRLYRIAHMYDHLRQYINIIIK